ncbi:MAG: DUF6325 family protein [Thermomicrobiales bacterium]
MPYGPIELLVVKFPGNQFTGELAPALQELVETGTIRIIDLLFVSKDENGVVDVAEIDGLGEAVLTTFDPLVAEVSGLLSEEDAQYFATGLEPNSSEALLLFENTWAATFAEAFRKAQGEIVLNKRIPRVVVEEILATAGAAG